MRYCHFKCSSFHDYISAVSSFSYSESDKKNNVETVLPSNHRVMSYRVYIVSKTLATFYLIRVRTRDESTFRACLFSQNFLMLGNKKKKLLDNVSMMRKGSNYFNFL